MCGSTRSTTSPLSSSTRRSTPWAAGCCGPKLMLNWRISVSATWQTLACAIGPTRPRRQHAEPSLQRGAAPTPPRAGHSGSTPRLCLNHLHSGLRRRLARLFVAGQGVIGPFPGRFKVERAELLGQLHRLVDDALGIVVVANFDVARQGEVLAQ